jgi:hypothetical protein
MSQALETWRMVVEAARVAHHAAAGEGGGKEYDRSQAAFKAAIHAAYPELDCAGIYGVWVDCMESVAYCADVFAKLDRDERRNFIALGGGLD